MSESHYTMQKRVNSDSPNKLCTTNTTTKPLLPGDNDDSQEPTTKQAATSTLSTTRFPINHANATGSDYTALVNKFRPRKPDWYQKYIAWGRSTFDKPKDAKVSPYMSQIFNKLKDTKANRVLEIGIGTGSNLRHYAGDPDLQVVGIDPNLKMKKYAQSAATSAGLPLSNFEFIQCVGEVIPLSDASVDAVVGTLVLCSVKDVDMTLKEVRRVLRPGGMYLFIEHIAAKDGTFTRFLQRVFDPLQQIFSDGCHLCRETLDNISKAGFSSVELEIRVVSNAGIVNPRVYGIAYP